MAYIFGDVICFNQYVCNHFNLHRIINVISKIIHHFFFNWIEFVYLEGERERETKTITYNTNMVDEMEKFCRGEKY